MCIFCRDHQVALQGGREGHSYFLATDEEMDDSKVRTRKSEPLFPYTSQ